jgi:hypothetical protein
MPKKVKTFVRRYSVAIIAGVILLASFTLSATIETTLAFAGTVS